MEWSLRWLQGNYIAIGSTAAHCSHDEQRPMGNLVCTVGLKIGSSGDHSKRTLFSTTKFCLAHKAIQAVQPCILQRLMSFCSGSEAKPLENIAI